MANFNECQKQNFLIHWSTVNDLTMVHTVLELYVVHSLSFNFKEARL